MPIQQSFPMSLVNYIKYVAILIIWLMILFVFLIYVFFFYILIQHLF